MSEFGNLKDDNDRLNEHTKEVTVELDLMIAKWVKEGFDARAIYSALAIFKGYYEFLAVERLGGNYVMALNGQAIELSQKLLAKRKQPRANIIRRA